MTLQTLTGHPNVSLAYLRLPDGLDGGGSAATGYQSLHRLLVGEISSITTVDGSATYTLDQLSATIVDLVRQSGAVAIRTHDFTTSGGTDDHPAVAQLVHDSTAGYEGGHTIYGYDDYDVASLPANVTGTDLEAKRSAFCTYAESDSEIDSENCPPDAIDEWLQRQVITGSEVRDPTVPTPTWAPVYRWWSATARDWLSVADHVSQPSASQLASQGYTKNPTTQFYASMVGGSGLVAVYRWWHSGDRDWIDVVDGSIPDSRMTSYGYTSKTLSYYAYSASATGRVAVYRWWGAADRDWITLRQGEIADSTMTGWGYTGKTLLGYALTTMPQTDPTYLTLVKKVVNDYGTPAPATSWTLSAAGPTPLSGAGGVPRTAVTAGTYTLSETGTVAGYTNGTTFTCATATGTPVTVTDNTLTLTTGQDVTCTITNTAVGSLVSPGSSAPSPVQRWWSSTARDWVTVPQHGSLPISSELSSYARTTTTQYYVSLIGTGDSDQVAVYRWWHPGDGDWIDVADGSIPDSRLLSYGYTDKTFQYFAWRSAATGRVAVYRWWSASDRDWITLRSGEIADSTLTAWGYTGKTLVAYAIQSRGSNTGYFTLGTPQSSVVRTSYAEDAYPHTMSVLDVNPARNPAINNGYRYLGYFGHNLCGGIYIARSNDLNATSWVEDPVAPRFPEDTPCRWAAAAIVEGNRIALVVNEVWDETITLQYSTDGLNGTKFGAPTTLVFESHASNGNPMLFQNPETGRYFLYWFRNAGDRYEIRAKSGTTIDGLVESGPADIGALVAYSDEVVAAPSVMYVSGLYYLAVETYESAVWRTRVLTSTSPTGPFYEIPGNPVYPSGAACVFQHVWGNELHSFYCRQNVPGDDDSWTLDHVRGNLLSPN